MQHLGTNSGKFGQFRDEWGNYRGNREKSFSKILLCRAEQAGSVKAEIWLTESDDGTIRIFAV